MVVNLLISKLLARLEHELCSHRPIRLHYLRERQVLGAATVAEKCHNRVDYVTLPGTTNAGVETSSAVTTKKLSYYGAKIKLRLCKLLYMTPKRDEFSKLPLKGYGEKS